MKTLPRQADSDAVRRAILPEVLRVPDVALLLGIGQDGAWRWIKRYCPHVKTGRRVLVRREALLDALRRRETRPPDREGARPDPDLTAALFRRFPLPHERSEEEQP